MERATVLVHAGGAPVPRGRAQKAAAPSNRSNPSLPRERPNPWPAKRAIRLASLEDVQHELARVYRGIARGELDPAAGCKLTYVLSSLGKVMEASVLEARIAHLEQAGARMALPYEPQEEHHDDEPDDAT